MSIFHWSFKTTCIPHPAFRGCIARLSTRRGCAQQVQPGLTSMLHCLPGFPQISSLPLCVQRSVLYLLVLVHYPPAIPGSTSRKPSMSSIYTGIWINWSHGVVAGSTLTLNERDGGLLTAFLAIFVSAAGAAAWRIMSYALHQSRARQEYQDGLHHQQQAILRNSHSPTGASWQLMQLTWFWRSNATRYLMRTIPLAGLALLNLALFGVAGVFSSEVTKAPGNETLVRSPDCGYIYLKDPGSVKASADYTSMDTNDTLPAAAYQRACYDNVENSLQYGQFIQRQLRWTSNQSSPCPFSPIQTKDYRTEVNDTDINSPTFNDTLVRYFYGDATGANYTYQYNKHSLLEDSGYKLM